MDQQEHRTRKDQKVRLRSNGQDALYSHAYAGSEGWVRDQKLDPLGYPLVFIEWDREHWADNGEPNKWAFEAHFEPVEGDEVAEPDQNDFMNFMSKAFEAYQQSQGSDKQPDEPEAKSPDQPESEEEVQVRFLNALSQASQAVSLDGEAFLMIAVHKVTDDNTGIPLHIPRIYTFYKTAAAGLLTEMQLPTILQTSMEELTLGALEGLSEDNES